MDFSQSAIAVGGSGVLPSEQSEKQKTAPSRPRHDEKTREENFADFAPKHKIKVIKSLAQNKKFLTLQAFLKTSRRHYAMRCRRHDIAIMAAGERKRRAI